MVSKRADDLPGCAPAARPRWRRTSLLKAGVSAIALAAIAPAISEAQSEDSLTCCNGADGSVIVNPLAPSPSIAFDFTATTGYESALTDIRNGADGTQSRTIITEVIGECPIFLGPLCDLLEQGGELFFEETFVPAEDAEDGRGLTLGLDIRIFAQEANEHRAGIYLSSRGGNGADGRARAGVAPDDATQAGDGGPVSFDFSGRVLTPGYNTHGIRIESMGGTGGTGGLAGLTAFPPSSGSPGGQGGDITLTYSGQVQTQADLSFGIWARANGGRGGTGGPSLNIIANGGVGATGGDGGFIEVVGQSGTVTTYGRTSYGILLESIGGGGGASGAALGIVADGLASGEGADGGRIIFRGSVDVGTYGENSHAIVAQSIGGGGGSAGFSAGLAALGSGGESAGNGGFVNLASAGTLFTAGDESFGLLAQSIGGGGGAGAGAGGLAAIGGDGGNGGDGGFVQVSNFGTIITLGVESIGLFGQSVGGGGGYGGASGGVAAHGGRGNAGGFGGTVFVENAGSIQTYGQGAIGMAAMSIGGGGGHGGASGGLVAEGGDGSRASFGGLVSATNTGGIETYGDLAPGILAQSIGGGGGRGGSTGGFVALGGDGVDGAFGGNVVVNNSGNILTAGRASSAIFAESIGGGGGSGGDSGGLVSTGGTATLGGNGSRDSYGGSVIVSHDGAITTIDDYSRGIQARSIGGGGGGGGDSGGLVSLGGSASQGGHGGDVSVSATGSILTFGHFADAIRAESTGGGGGEGGVSGGAVSLGGDGTFGGYGGDVTVLVSAADTGGLIQTIGNFSRGIFARSIGGGGGDGGDSGGLVSLGGDADNGVDDCLVPTDSQLTGCGNFGGNVTVINGIQISTNGNDSDGIYAESIGGGGGTAGDSGGLVSLGGDGGSSGYGGQVTVITSASIRTNGHRASGIFAQSIGGGGGTILDTEFDFDAGEAPDNGGGGGEGGVSGGLISLGGDGISGGDGGDVQVTAATRDAQTGALSASSDRVILTRGEDASAIFAQSIGGGGGDGGESGGIVSLGGDAGAGGIGGDVEVLNTFNLFTFGRDSDGIFARSIGGGGGTAGDSGGVVSLGGSWDAPGDNGGTVTVLNNGSITTTNAYSRGIYAESIGGGGGDGGVSGGIISLGGDGSAGGFGGVVQVTSGFTADRRFDADHTGEIITYGEHSDAILARSVGGGGGSGGDTGGAISLAGDANSRVGGTSDAAGGAVMVLNALDLYTFGEASRGIYAHSLGGGGGDGGDAYGAFPFLAIAIGGDGGGGAAGGDVSVTNTGNIFTAGFQSTGIFAQSAGGGGGNGGAAWSGSIGAYGSMSVSIGGAGGDAGHGGEVTVSSAGSITTVGQQASGIFAESIGGGGGTGGRAVAFSGAAGDTGAVSASVSVGGSGGAAGTGDTVFVFSSSNIFTNGFLSHGINAQSVGGGGGSGGTAMSISASASNGPSISASVAVGGRGGAAGDGGRVTVLSLGNIQTGGSTAAPDPDQENAFDPDTDFDKFGSVGIFAQSVGGGGGEGGMASSGTFPLGSGVSVGGNVTLGGSGGAGGDGATVAVTQSGWIRTMDHFGSGILAQSIGGGGGRAGMAKHIGVAVGSTAVSGGVTMGGAGGAGGDGGYVSVFSTGSFIETHGQYSAGIEAQSIGEGGGSGGEVNSGTITVGVAPVALDNSLGGRGGSGGSANAVDVDNSADITTSGLLSHGILAQSVGGGGGNGGSVSTFSGSLGNVARSVSVKLGGSGGGGGSSLRSGDDALANGGIRASLRTGFLFPRDEFTSSDVRLDDFITSEFRAVVQVDNTGDIHTEEGLSMGILAQSIGKGGGNGGSVYSGNLSLGRAATAVEVSLGGSGAGGGSGGNVFVDHSGSITTLGAFSSAINAHSIGGGGGNGGVTLDANLAGSFSGSQSVQVNIGGSGAEAAHGGDVYVQAGRLAPFSDGFEPLISTQGVFSYGILAQSVGGGGGNGGVAGTLGMGASLAGVRGLKTTLGGDGGGGGDGGIVNVEMGNGAIVTSGIGSSAVVAQSIGNGGGNGGSVLSGGASIGRSSSGREIGISIAGDGAAAGSGGFVSVSNSAHLRTGSTRNLRIEPETAPADGSDDNWSQLVTADGELVYTGRDDDAPDASADLAHGILAQSIGGGGGNGGSTLSASVGVGPAKTAAIGVSLGGNTADGSRSFGGDVWVENEGSIYTRGDRSNAIFAQSLGGGGGNGGWTGSISGSLSGRYSASGNLSIGGSGGGGSRGGEVRVNNLARAGWIYTKGEMSRGIFASSIGLGGGAGGLAISGAFAGKDNVNLSLGFGGSGGSSGAGGDVTVINEANILTEGDESAAIFAESRGGGGGNGGLAFAGSISLKQARSFNFAFGGNGGGGNSGGAVSVTNYGLLMTRGTESHAIFAQSTGGGGGNGGAGITGGLLQTGQSGSLNVAVSIGGKGGGTTNRGSAVTVNNTGTLVTTGLGAHGIFAQSIGGGGGNGGAAIAALVGDVNAASGTGKLDRNFQVTTSVGGSGGSGSTGGDVTIMHSGGIRTTGGHSIGVFGQSVGGGGGAAGAANSVSLQLARTCTAPIPRLCDGNSIKSRNYSANLILGGDGGEGGDGGVVTITSYDLIQTDGEMSHGIVAQSVGGGGGMAGDAESGPGALFPEGTYVGTGLSGFLGLFGKSGIISTFSTAAVGGRGGASGDGGTVSVTHDGDIVTAGDYAMGIMAQSVGGGGGSGGSSGAGFGVSIGGSGGASGDGGLVSVSITGQVMTTGGRATAVFAQSVGGGGGNNTHRGELIRFDGIEDDDDLALPDGAGGDCAGLVCVGGSGGSRGAGGAVEVKINAGSLLETGGDLAHGVMAQSIGGGGGNSDIGVNTLDIEDDTDTAVGGTGTGYVVSVGGAGGAAGSGGHVDVDNYGSIRTGGEFSHGIFAQSIGGGGGNAATRGDDHVADGTVDNYVGSLVASVSGRDTLGAVAVGGAGGASGDGGAVEVDNHGNIDVGGDGAYGVKAYSIGGGGGDSGTTFGLVSLGGSADSSGDAATGDGGIVSVNNHENARIVARGRGGRGISAMSLGGGGGSGGLATGALEFGGRGASGGAGGNVDVINSGVIATTGFMARGIHAQSIGGGGGSGATGLADFGVAQIEGDSSDSSRLGGRSGANGRGGAVKVTNEGTGVIDLGGAGSIGIFAQSVGGGGGDFQTPFNTTLTQLGGGEVSDADGGQVTVDACGQITVREAGSVGILAHSVGGGGGLLTAAEDALKDLAVGGDSGVASAGGDGGRVDVDLCGRMDLIEDNSVGVLAQSVGGSGGVVWDPSLDALPRFTLHDDGTGDGGNVDYVQAGNLFARGDNNIGVALQSLGGGGVWTPNGFRGTAGGEATGGAIDFDIAGTILATGRNSVAVLAQSEGGNGGGDITGKISGYVRGGAGGGAGVELRGGRENTLTITETGVLSAVSDRAIIGGVGNDRVINSGLLVGSVNLGDGTNSLSNEAGATFLITDDITLRSADDETIPDEVLAETASAVAGSQASSAKTPGRPVMEDISQTSFANAAPAQPASAPSGKPVDVPVMDAPPALDGAGNLIVLDPSAIERPQPAAASLSSGENAGAEVSAKMLSTQVMDTGPARPDAQDAAHTVAAAMTAGDGDAGPIEIDSAMIAFDMASARGALLPAPQADPGGSGVSNTGQSGTFMNSGTILMGLSASSMPIDLAAGEAFQTPAGFADDVFNLMAGAQVINTIRIDGDFVQTDTGHLVFDAAFGPYGSDQIIVSGDATVAGTGEVTLTWLENADPIALFTTGGTGIYDGLEIQDSAAVDYSISVGAEGVFLNIETDFGVMFSGENGAALGAAMDAAVQAGEAQSLGRLLAMLGNLQTPGTPMTQAIGVELNPEAHIAPMHVQLGLAESAGRDVFACSPGQVANAAAGCVWARVSQSDYDREATGNEFSVSRRGARFAGGFEQLMGRNWTRSIALGFEEHSDLRVDRDRAFADGQSVSLAVGARNLDLNGFVAGASLAAGWSWGDMQRRVSVFQSGIGTSEYETGFLRAGAEISRRLGNADGGFYAQPSLSIAATALRHSGLTETGLSGFGAGVDAHTQWLISAAPEISLGYQFAHADNRNSAVEVTFGARLSSEDELQLPIRFEGTSTAAQAANFGTSLEDVYTVSTRWNITQNDGFSLDLGYRAEVGDTVRAESAGFDFRWRF